MNMLVGKLFFILACCGLVVEEDHLYMLVVGKQLTHFCLLWFSG